MGWILGALAVFALIALLALLVPPVFGVALAGLTPLLVVIAVLGLGLVWWRVARHPVEPAVKEDQVEPEGETPSDRSGGTME